MQRRGWALMACLVGAVAVGGLLLSVVGDPRSSTVSGADSNVSPRLIEQVSGPLESVAYQVLDPSDFDVSQLRSLEMKVVGRVIRTEPRFSAEASLDTSRLAIKHQWPAITIEAEFLGDAVIVAFSDALNRFRLSFGPSYDTSFIISRPGEKQFRIFGLGPGPHHLRLEKISESLSGSAMIDGVFVPIGGKPRPAPPNSLRQMEFIGDSDTVGYGNLSSTRDCAEEDVFQMTDTSQSFGPRVARFFSADYQIIASSGIGLIRSLDGSTPAATMFERYQRTLFDEPDQLRSHDWSPQVIILALGPNDFENDLEPDEVWADKDAFREDFFAKLMQFLGDLRSRFTQAEILLLQMQDYDAAYIASYERAATQIRAMGDAKVHSLSIPKMEKTGCHWHPSLSDHQMIADRIIEKLEALDRPVWPRAEVLR